MFCLLTLSLSKQVPIFFIQVAMSFGLFDVFEWVVRYTLSQLLYIHFLKLQVVTIYKYFVQSWL